jgi:signal transduction histidine kinase
LTKEGAGPALASCERQRALALKALSVLRHDLRNLLASVSIIAERMKDTDDPRLAAAAPQLVMGLEQTIALGVRAQELVEAEGGTPVLLRLRTAALEAAEAEGVPNAARGLPDLAVMADPSHLGRILRELLSNAVRAAGEEGLVRMEAEEEDGAVTLRVIDDGPGVPDYGRDDLLTPFKGMKRKGGAGLGLPIAAALARANGGELKIERTGPDGTAVAVRLPSA